jgi:AmmeMemoRadiSam system protein B
LNVNHNFFSRERNSSSKRTIIFIGTEHASNTPDLISLSSFSGWKTPLGVVSNNPDMCDTILRKAEGYVINNNVSFIKEHSIENQIPFLQYFVHQNKQVIGNI